MMEPAKTDAPPQLNVDFPLMRDIGKTTKAAVDAHLPVDVVVLTVKECEFLAYYMQLKNPYRCWFDDLGYVYFEDVEETGDQDDKTKVALLRIYEDSVGPGGSLISVKNAVRVLRPKAVIASGICSGLKPNETNLGDVVVSAKLSGQSTGMRSPVSKGFLNIIKHTADGWVPPLNNPETQEIKVHCNGEFLSGPKQLRTELGRVQVGNSHPQATALEAEGEGLSSAAFDDQIEWLIVKGIADYAEGIKSAPESWRPFASVMAASVLSHILGDPVIFSSLPHYGDLPRGISMTKAKREPSSPSSQDPKRIKLEDSFQQISNSESKRGSSFPSAQNPKCTKLEDPANEFLNETQGKLRSRYNDSLSQVMISPCNRAPTVDIDEVYVELSFLRDVIKPAGTTKQKLEENWKIFDSHGHHLIPRRILVYGRPGIGKSTFTKKLSADWSRGEKEVLKQFTILLLVNLRDVCEARNPRSMIEESDLLARDDPMVDFDQLYNYILHNQKKVLLVLDGYDEYSAVNDEYSDKKSSPVHQIWRGRHLRDCTVLVTTRSTKKNELTPDSHVQFELNGFDSGDKIKDFIMKFLSDQKDIDNFVAYLNNQNLRDFAEVPLFLLMLCLTWKEKRFQGLPTSRPDLYERFIQTLFDHQSVKEDEYDDNEELTSIGEFKDDLSKLGKSAFDALLEDCLSLKLTILPEDIRRIVNKFVSVGLIQMSKFPSSLCREKGAFFLHKTIQEFLSARYIVQELMTAEEGDRTCLSKVDSFQIVKKMVEVLKFVCESSSKVAIAVLKHLQIIGEKEGLRTVNFTETPSVDELSEKQKEFRIVTLDCVLSCPASESERPLVYSVFLQCVKGVLVVDPIKQLPIIVREHVMKFSNSDSPKPSYIFFDKADKTTSCDVFSMLRDLGTVVVTCCGDTKAVGGEYTDLKEYVNDYFLKKESQQLVLYLTNIIKVSKVLRNAELLRVLTSATLPHDQKPVDHVSENTAHQEKKHSLSFVRHITLWGATDEELTVGKCVLSCANKPQHIDIPQLPDGCNDCDDLIQSISFTDNLHHLKLKLNDNAVTGIANSLHQAPKLLYLNLSGNNLHGSVSVFTVNLQCLTQLVQLKLDDAHLIDEDCRLIAKSLRYLCCLEELNLSNNPLGQGICKLAKHLAGVPDLTYLELWNTQMGREEVAAVACSLQSLSKLKVLNLSSNPLCQGTIKLSKHLCSLSDLTTLEMSATQMGEEEVTAVARVLKDLPALKLLNLSFNNPLGRGVSELTKHLSSIPQLGELLLKGIKITEEDACKLRKVGQDRGFEVSLNGPKPKDQSQTFQSVKMGNTHPKTNHWQARLGEKVLECVVEECPAVVHGLEHIADVYPEDLKMKTYIFYYFSQQEDGINIGPESQHHSPQEGTALIPMLRRDGDKHMCVGCFEKRFPVVLSSIRDSLQGRANFVNPDKTLHPVSFRNGETQVQ